MKPIRHLTLAAAATLLPWLTACDTAPGPSAPALPTVLTTPAAAADVFAPNANLHVQGIPPIPQSLVRSLAPYTDFRGHAFMDWHPRQREMLVTYRTAQSSTAQLYRLSRPLGRLEPLTASNEPIQTARYEPRDGRYILVGRSVGGNEAQQLFRLDPGTKALTQLTPDTERHGFEGWLHRRSLAIVTSVPLDRTAAGGTRASVDTTLWLLDPALAPGAPGARQAIATLPGGGWFAAEPSPDDRWLAITRYVSANESELWLIELASGERRRLLPAPTSPPAPKAAHFALRFSPDGSALHFTSDRASEFRELMRLDLASGDVRRLTGHIPWDVSGGTATDDGRLIAVQVNVDGSDQLRLIDTTTGAERPAPRLPEGNLGRTEFHRGTGELMFTLANARGPGQIYSLDIATGRVEPWSRAEVAPGLDVSRFAEQRIVRWPSFDGRLISGLVTRPPEKFSGRRPVIISIHGGPEGQATIGFLGRWQYFVQELGIAYIQPNVRGSSGFGKTFLTLDNGRLREDSVKDIGALLDWIATQPDLDPTRVLVTGGSYGGYMTLAVAATYPERIAGAVDVVGISHFVTFLETTESYRRDLRRSEYGDEREPAMREFLHRISPLTNAQHIKRPLFVVQGRNDPRVPWTEAEQIVAKVRANGTPVWYLRAENEGHGFVRRENADFQFYATVMFVRQTLLK